MDPYEVRVVRLALGYSVPMLAELLRVEPRAVSAWENGATPVPEWLRVSLTALSTAQTAHDHDLLAADGTFASRRRVLELSRAPDVRRP